MVSLLLAAVMVFSIGCLGVFAQEDLKAGSPESVEDKPLFVHYTEDELNLIPEAPSNSFSTRAVLSKTKPSPPILTLIVSNATLDSFSFGDSVTYDWVYSSKFYNKSSQIFLKWTKYYTSGTFGVETYEQGTDKYIGYTTVAISTAITGFNPPDINKAYYFKFFYITPGVTFAGTVETY